MAGERKKRGGSDSARENGLVGIVVHVTPQERRLLGMASESERQPGGVKAFVRRSALSAAKKILEKDQD